MDYITAEFHLNELTCQKLRRQKPNFGFGGFGEIVYYRSYSRMILDGDKVVGQEHWPDTVIRVINGVMSIRKDHYLKNRIEWNEIYWQQYASEMSQSMFRMNWLPPGRGLWAMGSDLIRKRGAMALYNCAALVIGEDWIDDLSWLMDTLMYGVGVGFKALRNDLYLVEPAYSYGYTIPDSREGWCKSVRLLLRAFEGQGFPIFDYDDIRPEGSLIKSFGGIASGPGPLRDLHTKIIELSNRYIHCNNYENDNEPYDEVEYKTDLANLIGCCVVTGNVRRSAELALGDFDDEVFWDLKNYEKKPERQGWAFMSNNSVCLEKDEHFQQMDRIAQANINGYDVGYVNLQNFPKGRIGKNNVREDKAFLCNPCSEIPLENREVCNLADTFPTRCVDKDQWLQACKYATYYCSTVSLLPTHQSSTNKVVTRNRRIGVGLVDYTGWVHEIGVSQVTAALREGYLPLDTHRNS